MTSLERLHAAVTFAPYDRPPFADNEWNEMLAEMVPKLIGCSPRADRRYSEEERAAAVRASQDMIPWCHIYDHPRYPVLGEIPPNREGQTWIDRDGYRWVMHGYSEWVQHRPFSDLPGFLAYLEKKAAEFRHDVPALQDDFEGRLNYARHMLGDVVIALPYLGARLDELFQLAGWDLIAETIAADPQAIADYLDAAADRTIRQVHLYADYLPARDCPVALGAYSDIACNTGLLASPKFLRLALTPAVRRIAAAYHEHGIKVVYHSEGNLRKFLGELLDAGVDGLNPLSPSEKMDAVEIRRLYPRLILWGGIDERAVLAVGTPETVRQEVARIVEGVGRGLILGSSGGVHPGCSVENCLALADAGSGRIGETN